MDQKEIDALQKGGEVSDLTGIYAPQSGYLFEKNIVNGSAFSAKQRLFQIVNIGTLWVEAGIYPQDIDIVSKLSDFTIVTPVGEFQALKEQLYPRLDKKEALATLRLGVQNKDDALKPGMYVSVNAASKPQSYLTLPATAVIFKNGKHYVFVVGEYAGEYEPKAIEARSLDSDTYRVQGLDEGDEVVNNALFMMDSDAQINGLY